MRFLAVDADRARPVATGPNFSSLKREECGQGLAEYIIIVILVAVLVLVGLRYFGVGIGNQFKDATRKLDTASTDDVSASSTERSKTSSNEGIKEEQNELPGSSGDGVRTSDSAGDSDKADIGAMADSISPGVGDSEVIAPPIRINMSTLLIILGAVIGVGIYIIVRFASKSRKVIKKKKKKKEKFSLSNDQGGQAMVEFVLSVITFLFCVLGVIQLALCLNAYTLVRYAAYNAARAGIVHEANLGRMREAARQSLLAVYPRHGRADHQRGITENYLGALATDQTPLPLYGFRAITDVRILNVSDLESESVITFDDPASAPRGLLTAEVTHHYELVVPLVNRIIYFLHRRWLGSQKTAAWGSDSVDKLAAVTDKQRRNGNLSDIEFRIPIVAHYTMRMQSDLVVP